MTTGALQRQTIDWVLSNDGYLHEDVELAHDPSKGHFLRLRADCKGVPAKTCLSRCAISVTLSYLNAIDVCPTTKSHSTLFPTSFLESHVLNPYTISVFFLVQQYLLGERSWWAPYIRSLPQPDDGDRLSTPLYFEAEDLLWLKGTNLDKAGETQVTNWFGQWKNGYRILEKAKWPNVKLYTWELCRWAATVLSSRSFSSAVLSDVFPKTGSSPRGPAFYDALTEGFPVLVPLVDLMNHRPLCEVEWQAGVSDVGLSVLKGLDAGQEVCNNYGPKSNEQLLLGYGFCIPDNPCEYFAVGFKIPSPSPLEDVKTKQFDQCSAPPIERYHIFSIDHPLAHSHTSLETNIFSPDLFNSISILSANDRELVSLIITPKVCWIPPEEYGNSRNTLNTLSQLLAEVRHRAAGLRRYNPQAEPRNQKQANAKIYRNTQLGVLETASVILQFSLLRARTPYELWTSDRSNLHLNHLLGQVTAGTARPGIKNTLQQRSWPTKPGELFNFEAAVSLLPGPCGEIVKQINEALLANLACYFDSDDIATEKYVFFRYAMILSFMELLHQQNKNSTCPIDERSERHLSPRLSFWLEFLIMTYDSKLVNQFDENFLRFEDLYVWASSEHSRPFERAQKFLFTPEMTRYDPDIRLQLQSLRWAWFVIQEEGVNVPRLLDSDEEAGAEYLMYIPHAPTSLVDVLFPPRR